MVKRCFIVKKIYSRYFFFLNKFYVINAEKKTIAKSIDYLKIVENVVYKADEMNLMCVSISNGGRGKQKNIL